jgi:hypothetical protein
VLFNLRIYEKLYCFGFCHTSLKDVRGLSDICAMNAYTLELSGDARGRLIAVVDAAVFASEHEITEALQSEP